MGVLVLAILAWIGAHTEYRIPVDPPTFEFHSAGELHCLVFGKQPNCKQDELPRIFPVALFDIEEGKILLSAGFNPDDPENVSTVVHELVHYVQRANGRFARYCLGILEAEAYRLEDAWRAEHDLPPLRVNPARMAAEACMPGPT